MPVKKISFFILILFISSLIQLNAQSNDALKERIRNASDFSDIIKLEKSITLAEPKGAIIQRIEEILPITEDEFLVLIHGKGIYKTLLYDTEGKFIRSVGEAGYDEQDYYTPSAIAKDTEGNIAIYDPPQNKICLFTPDNKFIKTIKLSEPGNYVRINSNGEIFLSLFSRRESETECIIKHDKEGKRVYAFAPFPKIVSEIEYPIFGNLLCFDKNDFVYELSSFWSHVRKYNSSGMPISEFGEKTIKMHSVMGSDGKITPYPREASNLFVCSDFLFIVYNDDMIDIYDLEGELVKKDLKNNKRIVSSADNAIYSVSDMTEKEQKVFKYILK